MKCTYRANKLCIFSENPYRASQKEHCQLCLIGQLCDEVSLLRHANENLTANLELKLSEQIMEAVHKEEYE